MDMDICQELLHCLLIRIDNDKIRIIKMEQRNAEREEFIKELKSLMEKHKVN